MLALPADPGNAAYYAANAEAAIADLEAEVPYPLTRVVDDLAAALARKSFHDRIAERLAEDPAWG